MNVISIAQQLEVEKSLSDELKKKTQDHKKDNECLPKMTSYNVNKAQMILDGITAERIR